MNQKLRLVAKGRDGWTFIFRDIGQTIRTRDYAEIAILRNYRGKVSNEVLSVALKDLKEGKYIYGDLFVILCNKHKVRLREATRCRCLCINELDVSIRVIRHKNTRGDLNRKLFDGMFDAIQRLIVNTMDVE